MALTIKNEMKLVRLIDSTEDNPLELTIGYAAEGRVGIHIEDRDAGTSTNVLFLDTAELQTGLALVGLPRQHYIEE